MRPPLPRRFHARVRPDSGYGLGGAFRPGGIAMAKSQKKSNKEIRKPKADKGPKQNASNPSLKPGGIKGLENMKNG